MWKISNRPNLNFQRRKLEGIYSRINIVEGWISQPEDSNINYPKWNTEMNKFKNKKSQTKQNIVNQWENFNWPKKHIIKIFANQRVRKIFEEITTEKILNSWRLLIGLRSSINWKLKCTEKIASKHVKTDALKPVIKRRS